MGKQGVIPRSLSKVHPTTRTPWVSILFTTALAFGLIAYVSNASEDAIAVLGGTTALLLLGVFAVVNVAVLVLRKDPVEHDHFHTNSAVAVLGAAACLYLVTPLSGRDVQQYQVAGLLLLVGLVLFLPVYLYRRAQGEDVKIEDPKDIV